MRDNKHKGLRRIPDRGDRPRGFGKDPVREFSRESRQDARTERRLEMHTVICAKCNRETEVPFKPTRNKPVYCRDCFRETGNPDRRPSQSPELEQINRKLDKIMRALKIE